MRTGLLDVHAHFLPDAYRAAAISAGHEHPDGFTELPAWSSSQHLELMDQLGIATSMLSISSPGVRFGNDEDARALARSVNEDGHRAVRAHPGRFGLLASLPLPDVSGSVDEIAFCLDELDADGFALLTNVEGLYLGDAQLEPVFDELDRRRARVLLHPTSPPCFEATSMDRPRPMIEFLFETTRTVVNLLLSGTIARHPNIEFIVPHAGATLAMVIDRVSAFSFVLPDLEPGLDVAADLRRLHFELAGFPVPRQLDALERLADPSRVHYGSDFPFTPAAVVELALGALEAADDEDGDLMARLASNTATLFPRLSTRRGV